ncbi:MAG: CHAT domain-containing protein [Lewinellaceae bacterium]|nr:CHAT domain-containing protein [Lewinellaceae bacterium]
MKTTLLVPAFFLLSFFVQAQNTDLLAIAQEVDSLLAASDSLFRAGAYRPALARAEAARATIPDANRVDVARFERVLVTLGNMQTAMGQYAAAEQTFQEAKTRQELRRDTAGEPYAAALSGLGLNWLEMARYDEAEPLLIKAREIQTALHGQNDPAYATATHNVARWYAAMSRFKEAEELFKEAKTIREQTIGTEHWDYATSLNDLGTLYERWVKFLTAEPLLREAKALREKLFGQKHPLYAQSISCLARCLRFMNATESEQLYWQEKRIREEALGHEHPHYATTLNNIGNFYYTLGRFEEAEPFLLESIKIKKKSIGLRHPEYARTLFNLGLLYSRMGRLEQSEVYLLDALDVISTPSGGEPLLHAEILGSISRLYVLMGLYSKGEVYTLQGKALVEKNFGTQSGAFAIWGSNAGAFYLYKCDYQKALEHYQRAAYITEKIGGDDLLPIRIAHGIGMTQRLMGQIETAVATLSQVRSLFEKFSGKENDEYANATYELAEAYRCWGKYDSAYYYHEEARAIWEKTLGREHEWYGLSLRSLLNLHAVQGQYAAAEPLQMEALALLQPRLARAARYMSARELDAYTRLFEQDQDNDFSIARRRAGSPGALPGLCYDQTLFRKGFLLSAAGHLRRSAPADSTATRLSLQWVVANRRLAAEYSKPPAERKQVAELEAEAEATEKELTRSTSGFTEALRQVKWTDVQARLRPGEAAIEFVRFRYMPPEGPTDSVFYAALLLRPGWKAPKWVPLFEENPSTASSSTQGERRSDYVSQLYTIPVRGATPLGKPQKTLYELIWKPLEQELLPADGTATTDTGVATIYFSPSGLLHRLNLAAIPIGRKTVLGDRYRLVELGSTRQVIHAGSSTGFRLPQSAVLFGGIVYDADDTATNPPNQPASPELAGGLRGSTANYFYQPDSIPAMPWTFLPETELEIEAIAQTLGQNGVNATVRQGALATEETFKQIGREGASPQVLHLATHGFFYPDPQDTLRRSVFSNGEPVFRLSDNPMMRSGILLAGANRVWTGGKAFENQEDGILTAYEISQMNLSNTELVVLSACETGLGDIQGNEGVYGLQRAFKIAGAKYLIMSLWQVPDMQTSLLMTTFYKKRLEQKMAIPEAFRAAQKQLREAGLDPYQWAGFVLVE